MVDVGVVTVAGKVRVPVGAVRGYGALVAFHSVVLAGGRVALSVPTMVVLP